MKKAAIWTTGVVSSGLFGYLSLRSFQWEVFEETIVTVEPMLCMLAAAFMVLCFNLRAYRWKYFLPQEAKFSFKTRLFGIVIGYFYSNIMPGRMGDIIRPGYLAKTNQQPYKVCIYSIVLERVWELTIFITISLSLIYLSQNPGIKRLQINFPIVVALIIFGVAFLLFSKVILNYLKKTAEHLKIRFLINFFSELSSAYEGNFDIKIIIRVIFLTATIYFAEGMVFVCLIDSLSLSIGFLDIFIVMIIVTLSIMLPSAPGAVGVFHYFCRFGLTLFGVTRDVAVSSAIVMHAFIFGFDFLFALFCLLLGGTRSIPLLKKQIET